MTGPRSGGRGEPASTDDVVAELRTTNRLLAVLATRGLEQRDAVLLLDAVGFPPRQIATVLGVKPTTVRVALHRARKALHPRTGGGPSASPEDEAIDGDE